MLDRGPLPVIFTSSSLEQRLHFRIMPWAMLPSGYRPGKAAPQMGHLAFPADASISYFVVVFNIYSSFVELNYRSSKA